MAKASQRPNLTLHEPAASKPLTAKQELFAREFILDRNGTQAAIRAGYSEKGASVQGSRLLSNVKVRARIDDLIAAHFERLDLTAERVLEELAALAFSNVANYGTVDANGEIVLFPWSDMPRHAFACVSELSTTPNKYGSSQRLKLHDKRDALRLLVEYFDMGDEKTPEERAAAIMAAMAELDAATLGEPESA